MAWIVWFGFFFTLAVFGFLAPSSLVLLPANRDCRDFGLSVVAFLIASVLSWIFVFTQHAWLRDIYRRHQHPGLTAVGRRSLETTMGWNWNSISVGIVERAAFAVLTFAFLGGIPRIEFGTRPDLAYVIGGWVVLKTLMGWRRIRDADAAVMRLSMVSIMGSLISVFSGVAVGVLMHWFVDC